MKRRNLSPITLLSVFKPDRNYKREEIKLKIILYHMLSYKGFLLYVSSISFILAALFLGIYEEQNKKKYLMLSLFFSTFLFESLCNV
ncbi:hypothetical protein [Alkanindiges illinoisensis]|uniref:hypothetical protein n=1 Tax=Alkanindiges illinoisensis TaxID=197183 RepID=UPI0012EB6475|nr:hypothetical protein [Alkanindiges illinoisensis]